MNKLVNKTNLIFGCTGQDGSFLCESLLKKGDKVIGITRRGGKIRNHIKLGIDSDIEVRQGEINNFTTIEKIISKYQPDRIFNLAAQSSVGRSFIEPMETIECIINGTLNLLEVSKKLEYSGKLFFAGSSEMFGNTTKQANVNHNQQPLSPYAVGKQASFNLVKMYRNIHNLKCMTGVLFNHESHLRNENFVTQKIIKGAKQIKNKQLNKIKLGNINISRDWGWAPDYVEAMQLIANSNGLKDHVICSGILNSLKTFIEKVFIAYDLDWEEHIEIDKNLFRPCEIKQNYGNPDPLFNDLGWRGKENLDTIIIKLIELSNNQ